MDFVKSLINHYNERFPETRPFQRGDSSFSVPALYEDESVFYVIRLKSNTNWQRLANELHPSNVPPDGRVYTEVYYCRRLPGKSQKNPFNMSKKSSY